MVIIIQTPNLIEKIINRDLYKESIDEISRYYSEAGFETKLKKINELRLLTFKKDKFKDFYLKIFNLRLVKNNGKRFSNVMEVFIKPHIGKFNNITLDTYPGYIPAIISPLPDGQIGYHVLLNKNKFYDGFVNLKEVRLDYNFYLKEIVIFVEDADKIDPIKAYIDFGKDMSKEYQSILREICPKNHDFIKEFGAGILSSQMGISYSVSIDDKKNSTYNVKSTFKNLRMSLPPIFRTNTIDFRYPNISKIFGTQRNIKVEFTPYPLIKYTKGLNLIPFTHATNNQTCSSLIENRVTLSSFLNLFQTANIISLPEWNEPELFQSDNACILNENVGMWLIKQRNKVSDVKRTSIFSKKLLHIMNGLMYDALPEDCLKFSIDNSLLVKHSLPRVYQSFFRLDRGIEDEEIFGSYLKGIEKYIALGSSKNPEYLKEILSEKKKAKTQDKELWRIMKNMFRIGSELPEEAFIDNIASNTHFKKEAIRKIISFVIGKGHLVRVGDSKKYLKRMW